MQEDQQIKNARELLALLGGSYSESVKAVSALERTLWELSFISDLPDKPVRWSKGAYSRLNTSDLHSLFPFPPDIADYMVDRLKTEDMSRDLGNGKLGFDLEIFQPFFLPRLLLKGLRPDSDLRYFVMQDIRTRYDCNLSPRIAHLFQLFADALTPNRVEVSLNERPEGETESKFTRASETKPKYFWNYKTELLEFLKSVPLRKYRTDKSQADDVNLFVECCRSVGYLRPSFDSGRVEIRTARIDAAYLLSNLFGMPTRMRGFDELFGGGGLMLTETLEGSNGGRGLGGRSALIMGRFGTGKSLLSLQLAVEVARKGGAAWVMLLEQSYQECLYTLEAAGAMPHDQSMQIATDVLTASELLKGRNKDQGVLIISQANKHSFSDFLAEIATAEERMLPFPFRLITVDPINSIQRHEAPVVLRDETVKVFDQLKRSGTNIVLVGEKGNNSESDLLFEQNIADTVIDLSVVPRHGYIARYFEIQKSRHQREQRGRHPFSIIPGSGVRIYASSAAISARMRPRATRGHKEKLKFGMPALDEILGESITSGDVIVFQGEGGSFKTPLGLIFLLGAEQRKRPKHLPSRSLLVSARDDEASIEYMLDQRYIDNHLKLQNSLLPGRFKTRKDIILCSLPLGYIQPGQILQRLEDEIIDARRKGYWIDRIMIDDVAHWEMSSPFISEDVTFGDTLLDFLRRHRVTGLIVCGPAPGPSSVIQRPIVDGSDCLVQFDRIEFRGTNRVMLQVLKTRGMRHRRESFEVSLGKTLDVVRTSSPLRAVRGEIKPVRIRLFLNSESALKEQYNNRVIQSLKSVLSEDTALGRQDLLSQNNVMKLGKHSAVDELQIVQFDEFQLPSMLDSANPDFVLCRFQTNQWDEKLWSDFLPSLRQRIRSSDGGFFAVPFYENAGLLAYRKNDNFDASQMSWGELAEECKRWESAHSNPKEVFFDFPKTSSENYNNLFLEILFHLIDEHPVPHKRELELLLKRREAVKAGKIFRQLCRRAYVSSGGNDVVVNQLQPSKLPIMVNTAALVWRHWYTTLNQMLYTLEPHDREDIQIAKLPGGVSIAGEWYLGVTASSAAPDVGLEVIKLLTSHEAELSRLQTGIGLPTRLSFYEGATHDSASQSPISPYLNMNMDLLSGVIEDSHRRSDFGCYSQTADTFAYHLQRIIAIPDDDEPRIEKKIIENLDSLITRLGFISSETHLNQS